MTRILAMGDLHLGAGSQHRADALADHEAVLEQILDLAVGRRVDLIVNAGDTFDRPAPPVRAQHVWQRFTRKLEQRGIPMISVLGNAGHDQVNSATETAAELAESSQHRVSRHPEVITEFAGLAVCTLPSVPVHRLVAQTETVDRAEVNMVAAELLIETARGLRSEAAGPALLLGHWSVTGASLPNGLPVDTLPEPVLPAADLAELGFDTIVMGHVHAPTLIADRHGVYTGSPMCLNFGEAHVGHGVWIIDIGNPEFIEGAVNAEFVPLDGRGFVTVDVDFTEDSSGERAASHTQEEGPSLAYAWEGGPDDQEPGMGARTPAPKGLRAEVSRIASGENAETSQDPIGLSPAGPALDETDQVAAALAEQFPLDDAIVRIRYTATEEQHRRVDAGALRKLAADAGAHKVFAIEPTIIRADRARVPGIDRGLDAGEALTAWCEANTVPAETAQSLQEILSESRQTATTATGGAAFDPVTLTARNVGRFADLRIDFQDGASVLLGPNGSGKSTALACLELALYAEDAGDLREIIAPWADQLEIELVFTLDGAEHRVRRALRNVKRNETNVAAGGKATLDFERRTPDGWDAVTQETASATGKALAASLGMSRALFRASCFLAQGDGPAFLTAAPKDRKELAAELLDPLGQWAADKAFASARAKALDQELAAGSTKAATLDETAALIPALDAEISEARADRDMAHASHTAAEEVLEQALAAETANAGAAERVKTAAAERDAAAAETQRAQEQAQHAESEAAKIPTAREKLAVLERLVEEIPELERQVEERRADELAAEQARSHQSEALQAARRQAERVAELDRTRAATAALAETTRRELEHLVASEDGAATCTRCEQTLGAQAREASIANLTRETAELADRLAAEAKAISEAKLEHASLIEAHQLIGIPEVGDAQEHRLTEARAAVERVATGRVLIQGYEELAGKVEELHAALRAAAATLTQKEEALAAASAGVKDSAQLAADVSQGRQILAGRRRILDEITATVTRLEERRARAQAAAEAAAKIRENAAQAQSRLDVLRVAERAFGRDGIPVLLLESVLPQIDADANTILRRFPTADGWTFSVRFETQREQASSDRVREELYVMVTAPDYDQDFRTLSGGEESRVSFAVRVALAMLLGRLRGADSRLLVLDELPFLDEAAEATLVDLVNELVTDGTFSKVLTVSHSANVRDAFAQAIEIEKRDGVSAVVGAREPVLV